MIALGLLREINIACRAVAIGPPGGRFGVIIEFGARGAQQSDAHPDQIGGACELQQHEQGGVGQQKRAKPGGDQHDIQRRRREDAADRPERAAKAVLRRDGDAVQRVWPQRQARCEPDADEQQPLIKAHARSLSFWGSHSGWSGWTSAGTRSPKISTSTWVPGAAKSARSMPRAMDLSMR